MTNCRAITWNCVKVASWSGVHLLTDKNYNIKQKQLFIFDVGFSNLNLDTPTKSRNLSRKNESIIVGRKYKAISLLPPSLQGGLIASCLACFWSCTAWWAVSPNCMKRCMVFLVCFSKCKDHLVESTLGHIWNVPHFSSGGEESSSCLKAKSRRFVSQTITG